MFWAILLQEIKRRGIGVVFISLMALLTVIIPPSAYTQARYYEWAIKDHATRDRIHQAENTDQAAVITRPVPRLLPLFNGSYGSLSDEMILRSDSALTTTSSENLDLLEWLFPSADLGLIIGVLMTLMAILLGHDAITEERENGTLKALLSCPVARHIIWLPKLMRTGLQLFIALLYTLASYIMIVVVFSGGAFSLDSEKVFEIGVFSLIGFLAMMVYASLGIAVSTVVKQSSLALAASMAIWVATVLVWPSLGPYLASSVFPAPSRQSARRDIVAKESEMLKEELAKYREAAASMAAKGFGRDAAWEEYIRIKRDWTVMRRSEVGRLSEEEERQSERQQINAGRLLCISPYGAFREAAGIFCSTGLKAHGAFMDEVERYDKEEFLPASFESQARGKPWSGELKAANHIELRSFQFSPPRPLERLKDASFPLVLLLLEIAALVAFGIFRFRHYEVG